jgi:hypothetical protein
MTIEDLQHIFQPQIDEGTTKLYYMLVDAFTPDSGITGTVLRHDVNDLESLLPMLDCFQYAGTRARMPRFRK